MEYLISVIIPVYKVEKYLEETIESVIHQSIGLENIEIILINDGSPDNSEEICLRYKEKYPDNIVYVKQKNSGVSATRNKGIEMAHGKYLNFLDSDDKWEADAYIRGITMLESHPEVDSVMFPLKFFEARTDKHKLSYMFDKDRTFDIMKDYKYIKQQCCSIIFRTEYLINYRFSDKLKISEDARFLTEYFFDHPKSSMVKNVYYLYRRRMDESSALNTSRQKLTWYIDTPKHCYEYLIDLSLKKFGKVIKYVQFVITFDMSHRMITKAEDVLGKDASKYYKNLQKVLSYIDDNIIYEQVGVTNYRKAYLLNFKHNYKLDDLNIKNNDLYFKDQLVMKNKDFYMKIYSFKITDKSLKIRGSINLLLDNKYDLYLKANEKYYKFTRSTKKITDFITDAKENYYDIEFELDKLTDFELYLKINDDYLLVNCQYDAYSNINELENSYYKKNKYLITHNKENNKFFVNKKKSFIFMRYLKNLYVRKDYQTIKILLLYKITYPFVRHNNYIVNDKELYNYIKKRIVKNNIYLNTKSKLKYMNSDYIISNSVDDNIRRPFGKVQKYLNSFMHYQYIYLGTNKDFDKNKEAIDIIIPEKDYKDLIKIIK